MTQKFKARSFDRYSLLCNRQKICIYKTKSSCLISHIIMYIAVWFEHFLTQNVLKLVKYYCIYNTACFFKYNIQ